MTIEVQPRIALSTLLDCGVDTLFYYEQPCLLTLTPAVAPEPELIVQLTLTNGQAQPSMLTFTNSAAPQQALITAVAEWTGTTSLTIGYTLLGSDFAHFFAVNDSVPLYRRGNWSVSYDCTPTPVGSQYIDQPCQLTVQPLVPTIGNITLYIDVGAAAMISGGGVLSWLNNTQSAQSLTVTAPPTAEDTATVVNSAFNITFIVADTDQSHYNAITPLHVQVLPRANISVNGLISGQTMYTLQVQPFTLSVLASEKANGDGVSIAMQCFGSSDSTWTPTLFNFSGSTQTLTGVYTASATAAVGESCTFTLTGPDVYHYNTLPPLNWTTTATATFNLSYAVEAVPPTSIASSSASIAAFAEQRIALTLLPTEAPLVTPIGRRYHCCFVVECG